MSDQISRDEELLQLKAENSRMSSENARLRAELESQGPVRVATPENRGAVMSTAAEMSAIFNAVLGRWAPDFESVSVDEFGRAFEILATFHRTPEPDTTRYAFHWVSVANARLRAAQRSEVSMPAFLAAALAWNDVAMTRWDLRDEGYLLEFGLSEFTGRLPRAEWRSTLAGRFVEPLDKRPRRYLNANAPRPVVLVDGRPLPDEMRYVGPRYQVNF